jgi:D-3-phosphoglycerate dehydrogenase / 2-oxoglutarate reductase
VGIIGLGQIGSEVARRCQALDMHTIGFDPMITEERAAAAGIKKVTLDALFAASDFITLHTPLNDATRNLICAATLAKCKKGVFIVNAARGGVVHEADLLEALNAGKVAGAALDVFESEPPGPASAGLIAHPSVICTPHLGASTEEAQKKVAAEIAQQMSDAFALKGFVGVVNAPHLALAHKPALEPFVRLTEALGR